MPIDQVFYVEKTKCMIFATGHKLRKYPDLTVKIKGSKIKQVNRENYLRLTLNEKLRWDKQVSKIRNFRL